MAYSPLYQNALQRSVPHLFRRPKTRPRPLSASPARRSTLREININTMSNKGSNEKSDMRTSESETPKLSEDSDIENFTMANTGFRRPTGDSDSNSSGSEMDLRNRFPTLETARLKEELAVVREELMNAVEKRKREEHHTEVLMDALVGERQKRTALCTEVTNLRQEVTNLRQELAASEQRGKMDRGKAR